MEKLIPKRIVSQQAEKVILDHDGEIRPHEILLRKVLKEMPGLIEGTTIVVFTSGKVICYTNDGVVWRPR